MKISIPVSAGELLDKISILEIKKEKIQESDKKKNVSTELNLLRKVQIESELVETICPKILEHLYKQLQIPIFRNWVGFGIASDVQLHVATLICGHKSVHPVIGDGTKRAKRARAPQFLLSLHRNVIFLHTNVS